MLPGGVGKSWVPQEGLVPLLRFEKGVIRQIMSGFLTVVCRAVDGWRRNRRSRRCR